MCLPSESPRERTGPSVNAARGSYDTLAGVYEWLVPDPLSTPHGAVDAFAVVVDSLQPGARVLDCAAGTGQLAVGLALRGHDVVASDASAGMVERTRALANEHGVDLPAVVCEWESLGHQGWQRSFDAIFCVGNSITHAGPTPRRRAALAAMAGVLRHGGLLVLTSRNWDLVRALGSGIQVADHLIERRGERALVIYGWTLPDRDERPLYADVAVALIADDGMVTTHHERLEGWPFTHTQLDADLRAAGMTPQSSTYADEVERYMVTARRS
jgi:SAM-dependent methyltransferase